MRMKHENVVQWYGTITDPTAGKTALFMEQMAGSLTEFLKGYNVNGLPLPYYTQRNICHDVVRALVYLHSNGIIHRDLSSNNVLLTGNGSRAKVTDFGTSKLINCMAPLPQATGIGMLNSQIPMIQCPGAPAYMPPEALNIPAHYSDKLDCFSFGVLIIQVATTLFPDSRPPFIQVWLPYPLRIPEGTGMMYRGFPEG